MGGTRFPLRPPRSLIDGRDNFPYPFQRRTFYSKVSRLPHVLEPVEKTRSGAFCANLAISPSPVLYAVLRGNGGRGGQRPRGKPGDRTLNDSKDGTQPRERVFPVLVYRRRVSIVPSLRAGARNAREGEPALAAAIAAANGDGRVQRPQNGARPRGRMFPAVVHRFGAAFGPSLPTRSRNAQ